MKKPPKEKPYQYVTQTYGVPVSIGCRVQANWGGESGELGTVVRKAHYDHYVHVRFDGQRHDVPVHPLDLTYAPTEPI